MDTPLLTATRDWHCPNCGHTERTQGGPAVPVGGGAARFHRCAKLRGMLAPLLLAGVSAKVEVREREDYVGREAVTLDPERGRPVMSVVTTRDDGQDVVVFAPTATGRSD
jgi:hypothetical protein